MLPLLNRLRAAGADNDLTAAAAISLLREAANEIERLQRIAYRESALRPADFKGVQLIRRRHYKDAQANDFAGRAWHAHIDRGALLAIIAFTSQQSGTTAPRQHELADQATNPANLIEAHD